MKLLFESADTPKPPENVRRSSDYKYPTGRTAPASTAAFPPTMQVPRRTPRSLSLGSLGVISRVLLNRSPLIILKCNFDVVSQPDVESRIEQLAEYAEFPGAAGV